MKRLLLLALFATLCIAGSAQAPRGSRRIILQTEYTTIQAALDALIIDVLPDLSLTPCWIDYQYGLVKTEDEDAKTTTARLSYFFQIREEGGRAAIEVTGKYFSYLTDKFDKRIELNGMRGSMVEKTFREMEDMALAIPHTDVFYK